MIRLRPRFFRPLPVIALAAFLAIAATPAARAQSSTTWIGTVGNWDTDASWSNGEPTADLDAILPLFHTVTVSMAGETCRNLILGQQGGNPTLNVTAGGSLSVVHRIQIPMATNGTMNQQAGTVSADSMVLGAMNAIGQFSISSGTLNLNHLLVGSADPINATATYTSNIALPVVNVAHSITVGRAGNMVHGAGTLNAGTTANDTVVVYGGWQMVNRPTTNVRNFVFRPLSLVNATILFNGITPIVAANTFVLRGQLTVFDVGAPDGTYELFRGAPLTGAFDTVILPAQGNWSWRIEGNSFYVTRGTVAVEPGTWSRVKARNFRS